MNKAKMCDMAAEGASTVIKGLDLKIVPSFGLVLGTGFNKVVDNFAERRGMPIEHATGLNLNLSKIDGHNRQYVAGIFGNQTVIAVDGRYHLNEAYANENLGYTVRLQIQILLEMGIKNFILTCAAGSLGGRAKVGDLIIIDGFVTLYMPDMPSFGGEFGSAEDAITNNGLVHQAIQSNVCYSEGRVKQGGYAMVRGPGFEGRKYDKKILADSGASAVGMSMIPESTIISLYPEAHAVGIAFITNDDKESHSHEENQKRVNEKSKSLGAYLADIIKSY